jgi:hypothetical protein
MAGARRAVRDLVLFDVFEVPVEIRDEHDKRRAVGVAARLEPRHRIRRVDATVDDGHVGLAARRGQFALTGFARKQFPVDFLFRDAESGRNALNVGSQAFLIRAPRDCRLKQGSIAAPKHDSTSSIR